jgi:electron transfer flavoprotein alpha subunit
MTRNVLVITEQRNKNMRNVSLEALSAACTITEGGKVAAALCGSGAEVFVSDAAQHGAEDVYLFNNPVLDQYIPDAYAKIIEALNREVKPDVVLYVHTAIGRDNAPKIAQRFAAGLITDATALEVINGQLVLHARFMQEKRLRKKSFHPDL